MSNLTEPKVCCIFGHTHWDANTNGEQLTYQMALFYQINLLIERGVLSFISQLTPGIDLWCTDYIAGIINTCNAAEDKSCLVPAHYSKLTLHVFHMPTVRSNLENAPILRAAFSVLSAKGIPKEECVQRIVNASTHMFAVYDEWETPFPLIYARERGLEIIRFTPQTVLTAYRK